MMKQLKASKDAKKITNDVNNASKKKKKKKKNRNNLNGYEPLGIGTVNIYKKPPFLRKIFGLSNQARHY